MKLLFALTAMVVSTAAQAHGLEAGGFLAGLAHPVGGADHLLAMLAVGLVSTKVSRQFIWLVPALFLCGAAAGYLWGLQHHAAAGLEGGVVASLIVLGLLTAQPWRPALPGALLAVVLFGFCHGHAHGNEWPVHQSPWAFSFGFLATSAGLHVIGVIVGLIYQQHGVAVRWFAVTGLFISGVGVALGAGTLLRAP